MIRRLFLICYLLAVSHAASATQRFLTDTLTLFDNSRSRSIPVEFSLPSRSTLLKGVVIFSHGYNQNQPGSYLGYTWLKQYMTDRGYAVVSIQHELPDDSLLTMDLPARVTRWSNWKRGAANILYVANHIAEINPSLKREQYLIMGHSNGGDMSALFATEHPELCERLITLDNRRMTLPVLKELKVASIRSADQPADEGVIPDEGTQEKFQMLIVKASGVIHNHMGDAGTSEERNELIRLLNVILEK
mgnify:CR=1 FL=1